MVRIKELQEENGLDPTGSNFVFISEKGEALEPRTYTDYFYALIKVSGIAHANYHSLRHTFATRANEIGIKVSTLSELLGHAQPSTTQNMYIHDSEEEKAQARNKLDQMQEMFHTNYTAKPVDVAQS